MRQPANRAGQRQKAPAGHPRNLDLTVVSEWREGQANRVQDFLVGEEPLEIRIGDTPVTVTMRTPGQDFELAAGFLFTEGIVRHQDDIADVAYAKVPKPTEQGNVVTVRLRDGLMPDLEDSRRNFYANSSCGVCGKAAIDSVRRQGMRRPDPGLRIDANLLCGLPEKLLAEQALFEHTGGLHAAALFDSQGTLLFHREDVGRHNTVDKIVGRALLEGKVPLSRYILLVSGRGGFEIIQKAIAAGIPIVASVSAPSSLAVRLAREVGQTLVGFLRGRRFVVYSGDERLGLGDEPAPVE